MSARRHGFEIAGEGSLADPVDNEIGAMPVRDSFRFFNQVLFGVKNYSTGAGFTRDFRLFFGGHCSDPSRSEMRAPLLWYQPHAPRGGVNNHPVPALSARCS